MSALPDWIRFGRRASGPTPPGPTGLPLIGSLFDYMSDQLDFVEEIARRHGDVARFRLGAWDVVLVSHPSDIERVLIRDHERFVKSRGTARLKVVLGEGLLTSEGEVHLRRRRQVQPAFHRRLLKRHGKVMVRRARALEDRWSPGASMDLAAEMRALALGIAGECFFGAELESDIEEIGEALDTLVGMYPRLVIPFSEILERLPLPATLRFRRARERLDAVVYHLIDDARARMGDRVGPEDDFRARAREGARAEAGEKERPNALATLLEAEGKDALDREEIRDEVITLLLAGHETTANALSWTFYLLARNPGAEAALHREVDEVLDGRPPTVADLPRLETARRILAEALRLYPPAWLIGRRAVRDWEVGGYPVPEGSMVFLSQWVVHRDSRWWPEPERFDPDRWEPEREEARPRFAYFPFGGGRRLCIGEGFAWMEGILVLATLARRWRPRLARDRAIGPSAWVTLRPEGGVPVVMERRDRASGTTEG